MELKLSQQALGDRIGVSKVTISDLELGHIQLNVDYMRRISFALGVAPTDLLTRDDNPLALSARERNLIARLRHADEAMRDQLHKVADVMLPWKASEDSEAA